MAEKLVAIIGRPNVGKSTFFNRMTQQRQAIVDAVSGVTRDRHYGKSDWNGSYFSLVDTGGYITGSEDEFEDQIRRQVLIAIDEADFIIFMVDVQSGVTDMDRRCSRNSPQMQQTCFLGSQQSRHAYSRGGCHRVLRSWFG
jgi:GTP-binding protein